MLTNLCSIHFLLLLLRGFLSPWAFFFFFLNYYPYFLKQVRILLNPVCFFEPLIIATNHLIVGWLEIPGIPDELFHGPGTQTLPDFPTGWNKLQWVWQLSCSHHPHLHTSTGALFPEQLFLLPLVPPTTTAGPGGEFVVQQFKRNLVHPALNKLCQGHGCPVLTCLQPAGCSSSELPCQHTVECSCHTSLAFQALAASADEENSLLTSEGTWCCQAAGSQDIKKSTLSAFPQQHNNTTQAPWLHKAPVNVL